jgi:uncharacterized DUF497 family protein
VVDWTEFLPSDFEYDDEADHLGSHGVTLEEAAECFYNEHVIRKNRRHGYGRWQLIGKSDAGRPLKVIFELRPRRVVRIITGWPL